MAQEESSNTSKCVKFGKKMNVEKGCVQNIVCGCGKTIGDYFNLAINEKVSDFLTGQGTDKEETEWMATEHPELCIIEEELTSQLN